MHINELGITEFGTDELCAQCGETWDLRDGFKCPSCEISTESELYKDLKYTRNKDLREAFNRAIKNCDETLAKLKENKK